MSDRSSSPDSTATISDSGAGGPPGTPRVYRLRSPHAAETVLAACATAVDDWGGEWTARESGAELQLPVHAGLRRGIAKARATAARSGGGSELAIEVEETNWWLHRSAVVLLVTAAITAVGVVLWPFFPALANLVPLGLILGASVWLAFLARLRHAGPAEFLAHVEETLEEPARETNVEEPPPPIAPR